MADGNGATLGSYIWNLYSCSKLFLKLK